MSFYHFFTVVDNKTFCKQVLDKVKGAVSYFTHMLLHITNLKALGQRFQKGGRKKPDEKNTKMMKIERNNLAMNQCKRVYLVNNIFEAWENEKIQAGCKRCSDSDFAAICYL